MWWSYSSLQKLALYVVCLLGIACSSMRSRAVPELPVSEIQRFTPAVAQSIASAGAEAKANPGDVPAVGRYCMVLHAHEQFGLAADCYAIVAGLAPDAFEWWYRLAVAAGEAGRTRESGAALDRSLTLRPDYVPARLRRAAGLLDSGNSKAGQNEYRALLVDSPQLVEAYYGLGRSLAEGGAMTEAASAFETACRLFPRYAAAHYAAAQLYRRMAQGTAAAEHLRLYELSKGDGPVIDDPVLNAARALNAGAQIHIQRSVTLEAAGRLEEAAEANMRALDLDSRSVQAHVNLVSLYGRLQQFENAKSHFLAATALDPDNADAHYNYGVLLMEHNRREEAFAEFRRTLDTNSGHADAHNNYGLLLEERGRVAEAMSHFRIALQIAPSHRGAHYHVARLLIGSGKPIDAIPHLRLIAEPEHDGTVDVFYAMATAYAGAGEWQHAFSFTRKAYDLALKYHRADLLDRLRHDLRVLGGVRRAP